MGLLLQRIRRLFGPGRSRSTCRRQGGHRRLGVEHVGPQQTNPLPRVYQCDQYLFQLWFGLAFELQFLQKILALGQPELQRSEHQKQQRHLHHGFQYPVVGQSQFGNREVLPNFGFNMVWKWHDSFLWQTPLAEGVVSSFSTLDAQVSLQVPKWNASFKLGGTNLSNNRYIQYAAGPTIGALYYLSMTWDVWKK